MLIATTVLLLGLLVGIVVAQLYGLRLGGVIIVPLVAVYLLRSFATFPIFLLSTIAAYVSLYYIKRRIPIYGRHLFLLAILTGALVPILVIELITSGFGVERTLSEVEFVGSVLPGIAAYNFHRLDPERRVTDGILSLAVLLLLVIVGIVLTIFVGLTPLSTVLPPLLLSPESDIAVSLGLTVQRPTLPVIASTQLTLGLVMLGMAIAELMRSRYGLRLAGVIVLPLVALIAFRNEFLLPVWVVSVALAYVGISILHRWTLIYGRVLLAFGVIVGILTTISLVTIIPVRHGLLPFFIGLLAGITAYNFHVVPPAERLATVAVTIGALVGVIFVARLFIIPSPRGLLVAVTATDLRIGGALLVPAGIALIQLERIRPSRAARPKGGGLDLLTQEEGE
jgi:hypothetical protein